MAVAKMERKDRKPPAWDIPLAAAMIVVAVVFAAYLVLNFQSLVLVQ